MALPYITIPELEKLEQYAANMSSIYMVLDCNGVNFDTIDHPSDPVNIPGIWLTLSKNKKLTLFKNYKIDGVEAQANFANANIASDDEGYYLQYSTPYGNFYVRPTDDVYFLPRTIKLDGIIEYGAKFTIYDIARDGTGSAFGGYRYDLPDGTIPNKISKYIAKCTLTLACRYEVMNAPLSVSLERDAEGKWSFHIATFGQADRGSLADIPLVFACLYVD